MSEQPTLEGTQPEIPSTTTAAPTTTVENAGTPSLLNTAEPQSEPVSDPEAPPPAKFDPDKLKLGEGFVKNALYDDFVAIATKQDISHEMGQELIDLWTKGAQSNAEAGQTAWREQNETWQAEVKADPELGGSKLPEVLRTVAKLFDDPEIDGPQLRKDLDMTGAGNVKSVVKAFYVLLKRLSEGSQIAGNPPDANARQLSQAERFYYADPPTATSRME